MFEKKKSKKVSCYISKGLFLLEKRIRTKAKREEIDMKKFNLRHGLIKLRRSFVKLRHSLLNLRHGFKNI